jgi:hypothetical protein
MNNTKNKFKTWLKQADYKEVLAMYQTYKEKLMLYNTMIAKTRTLYPKVKGADKLENIHIVKWKYMLLTNKLNLMVIKNG